MAKILLVVSALPRFMPDAQQAMQVALEAFKPYGVELQLQPANALADDPSRTALGWSLLQQDLRNRSARAGSGSPAHIVFASLGPGSDASINGELMDRQRGICAIFMQSDSIRLAAPGQRMNIIIQVCIHELGHLLNLTHGDGEFDTSYVCAMRSYDDRARQTPDHAWALAIEDADQRREQQVPKPSPTRYYPFGAMCRANLREAAFNRAWWPWQSNFRGPFDEPRERDDRGVALAFIAADNVLKTEVHDGLAFSLQISRRGADEFLVPLHIGPEFGTLRITIKQPDGNEVLYQPIGVRCSSALVPLQDSFIRSFSIVPHPDETLFPVAGDYLCRVTLKNPYGLVTESLASASMPITVRASKKTRAARRAAVRVVAAARNGIAQAKAEDVQRTAEARGMSVAVQHATYKLAACGASSDMRLQMLESCMQPPAPAAIRHRAARRWALEQHVAGMAPDAIKTHLAKYFPDEADLELHETIQRMEEGWQLTALV